MFGSLEYVFCGLWNDFAANSSTISLFALKVLRLSYMAVSNPVMTGGGGGGAFSPPRGFWSITPK